MISRRALKDFSQHHPDSYSRLDQWYRITRKANWASLIDVQKDFNHAEAAGRLTVFNIKGNAYRLVARINYRTRKVFVRRVMTHNEYQKGAWKE